MSWMDWKGECMERLTTNKNVYEMGMVELAHNSCFAKDRKAMYRDFDTIIDAREFARNLIKCRGLINIENEIFNNDDAFDEFMAECLAIDPRNGIGLVALFYRGLWAQADLYETLKCYEDSEEQGLLLRLPCKLGDTVFAIFSNKITRQIVRGFQWRDGKIWAQDGNGSNFGSFGKTVFLTQTEAEEALGKMKGVE